jgi:hypothetical protein
MKQVTNTGQDRRILYHKPTFCVRYFAEGDKLDTEENVRGETERSKSETRLINLQCQL